ncbi:MAG: hypothetical protein ACE5E6_01880 [Phycisphaerae bacterium]
MAAKRSFLLRLPPELWADVKRLADVELRSVNAQIEYILRDAVRRRRGEPPPSDDDIAGERPEFDRP